MYVYIYIYIYVVIFILYLAAFYCDSLPIFPNQLWGVSSSKLVGCKKMFGPKIHTAQGH